MSSRREVHYESALAPFMELLVQEKRATGYKYNTPYWVLKNFDNFLCQMNIKPNELPEDLVLQWLEQRPKEQASTYQRRVVQIRQLARLMIRLGHSAFIPPYGMGSKRSLAFSPRILTREEVNKVIHAADQLKPNAKAPWRYLVMPELFRLLYSCGFRLCEVLNLRISDVNLTQGVITVRNAKFGKDRLVPPSLDMLERLRIYKERIDEESLEKPTDNAFFFPSSNRQTPWSPTGIYFIFRKLLYQCGISHLGRGKGQYIIVQSG